ncbi:MAG: hydrogen peroxide-inducible genes activator, partial [Ferruginibacter sp.]|nr:hydrogen peroxide-inducible genes activator [Ferruginibacter sp.]
YETGSIETLKNMVEKNGGITLLPELATMDMNAGKKAMLRYFKNPAPSREISMVTIKGFVKTRLTGVLRDCITAHLPMEVTKKKTMVRVGII